MGERAHVTTALASRPTLNAHDRCDRCGAQAYIRVELAGGGELLFCGHHGRKHLDGLRSVALRIHDETERLTDVPASAADEER
ncbi:MAG: hypothetical protein GEU93_09430 [Propionibacteriales bacterium]|nr:hypothetical protein [Propionibacteriales bacterium]